MDLRAGRHGAPRPAASRRVLFGGAGAAALLSGCAAPARGPAVPLAQTRQASVLGLPNERFFPLSGADAMLAEFMAAAQRQRAARGLAPDAPLPALDLLSVSGGGENGAFGAGLLCGWTEHGDRPVFAVVTGVSTGALTAPFAYLGPAYDGQLRAVYTELTPDHVLASRGLVAALFDDALNDNSPLFRTISHYLDATMLAALARAYTEGRLLLIGTADLDAQQPVIWNIGAIAASGDPRALDTIRRVLLASAAVPGAFPPTMFDVTVDGQPHQEMHVDGGAFAQAFLYPAAMTAERRGRLQRGEAVIPVTAWVIRNGRLDPEWSAVQRRVLSIVGRAISTMITASGYNDVLRMYFNARHDDIDFHLAYIGADFDMELPEPFDQGFMRALFDYGYQRGRRGYDWASRPPG